jgi:hypothetical protein
MKKPIHKLQNDYILKRFQRKRAEVAKGLVLDFFCDIPFTPNQQLIVSSQSFAFSDE